MKNFLKMKTIKKIFILAIFALLCTSAYSQTVNFRTVLYSQNFYNTYYQRWSGWSEADPSDMLGSINFRDAVIVIYSPVIQVYRLTESVENGTDSDGDRVTSFKFIDQDGDTGLLRVIATPNNGEYVYGLYIIFSDVAWCYKIQLIEE